MNVKKMLTVVLAMVLVLTTVFSVYAEEPCVDCCENGPCVGDDANTPRLDVLDCVVQINDRVVTHDVTVLKSFERGEELEVEVEFTSLQDAEDVYLMAMIGGYHRQNKFVNDVFDLTSTFNVEANVSYKKTLRIRLPDDFEVDTGDELKLRVEIADKYSSAYVRNYNLKVDEVRDSVIVQDVVLDPSGFVEAGRGLFASVRVRNMGKSTEESLKVEVAIPALGLKATEYIDELESDEATTSEDLFLRIPSCAEPGEYLVRATVEYADGDEEVVEETTIEVGENPSCGLVETNKGTEEKTVVTVPGKQDVVVGTTGTVYPVILQNNGVTDRSYEVTVSGLDSWATYRVDPGAFVVVRAGETKTLYLYVAPNEDAQPGEKIFMVSVETNGDEKQIALTANVVADENADSNSPMELGGMKKALEIGLIVLIVLLIVLGLIVGFNKLKGNDEPDEVSGQTYY